MSTSSETYRESILPPSAEHSGPPPAVRAVMDEALASPMPRGRGQLFYRETPRHLDRPLVAGKTHIVFIGYYPTPAVIRKSAVLRASGTAYTTFIGCCIREDADILAWFDQAYEVEHYRELYPLLDHCAVSAVNICNQPPVLAAIAIDALDGPRVVLDLNDAALFLDREKKSPARQIEQHLLARAAAFLHKMPPLAVDEIRRAYGLATPDHLVHALPLRELCTGDAEKDYHAPWRLAFAGGVVPPDIAKRQGHGNHLLDPIIRETADLGMRLDFHVNQNARNMYWQEHQHYFDLERTNPHFHFRKGVPFFELPPVLADSHFGLLYDNLSASSYPTEHFSHTMATKVFTYLEAGLPLLVYEEFTYICDLVREHSIGVVYSLDRIKDIPALLDRTDYRELTENVHAFRQSHEMRTNIDILRTAYGIDPWH